MLYHVSRYNAQYCPNPYCVCASPLPEPIAMTREGGELVTVSNMTNLYAATAGPSPCPYLCETEAGSQILVAPKSGDSCGRTNHQPLFTHTSPDRPKVAAKASNATSSVPTLSAQRPIPIPSHPPTPTSLSNGPLSPSQPNRTSSFLLAPTSTENLQCKITYVSFHISSASLIHDER